MLRTDLVRHALFPLVGLAFACASHPAPQPAPHTAPPPAPLPAPSGAPPTAPLKSRDLALALFVAVEGNSAAALAATGTPPGPSHCWTSSAIATLAVFRSPEGKTQIAALPVLAVPGERDFEFWGQAGEDTVWHAASTAEVTAHCQAVATSDDESPANTEPEYDNGDDSDYDNGSGYDAVTTTTHFENERIVYATPRGACVFKSVCDDVSLGCGGGFAECSMNASTLVGVPDEARFGSEERYSRAQRATLAQKLWENAGGQSGATDAFEADEGGLLWPRDDYLVRWDSMSPCMRWAGDHPVEFVSAQAGTHGESEARADVGPAGSDLLGSPASADLARAKGRYPWVESMAATEGGELLVALGKKNFVISADDKPLVRSGPIGHTILMAERAQGTRAEELIQRFTQLQSELRAINANKPSE